MTVTKTTQADHVLQVLEDVGPLGAHTFQFRAGKWGRMIGNPSQRFAELRERGIALEIRRERLHGDAIGARVWLAHMAPGAVPTEPSGQTYLIAGEAA